MNKRAVFSLAIAIALTPFAAHAQTVGGLQTFAMWLAGPIATPVLIIGGIGLGIVFCVGRRDWEHMVNFAIGGGIIGSVVTIAAMFAQNGGG